jgi:proteic killer suppression protein
MISFTPGVKEGSNEVELEFEDDDLRRLYTQPGSHSPSMGPELLKQYRKKVGLIAAARDERDLMKMRSLRFEKLRGSRAGQHSVRLNDQWRLILRLVTRDRTRTAIVVEVVDYH